MKTNLNWLVGHWCLLAVSSMMLLLACSNDDGNNDVQPTDDPFVENWTELVSEILPDGDLIYVDNNSSLRDAVSAAESGDAIIIEGGNYDDNLVNLPSSVRVFGVQSENGAHVITSDGELPYEPFEGVSQIRSNSAGTSSSGSGRAGLRGIQLLDWSREMITSDVARYSFTLRVGEGKYDVIGVNRVVKERKAYHAIRPDGEIFMVHGSSQNFSDIFLVAGSESQTPETSLPVFLAENRIDVWGIDLGWTRIPQDETDFSSLMDWGINRDSDHTQKAMAFARLVRVLSGSGFSRLNLLGFSYGAYIAFDAAGDETQQFRIKRDIKGIIPADQAVKYAPEDEEFRLASCAGQQLSQMQLNAGMYANPQGLGIATIGNLALGAPNDLSPIPDFDGLTNLQVAVFTGANTYFGPGSPSPFWHFVGGNQASAMDLATDLQFTDLNRWVRLYADLPPFMPEQAFFDVRACSCNEDDVEIDDHIGDITVPVFYYGAAGGTGVQGLYTNSLVASSDVSSFIATQDSERFRDYGHADLFTASMAYQVAWPPLLQWLQGH